MKNEALEKDLALQLKAGFVDLIRIIIKLFKDMLGWKLEVWKALKKHKLKITLAASEIKCIFDICSFPELHTFTRVVTHIFNGLNDMWGENRVYE